MGFAAFIFASLLCVLRAKGFFAARPHPAHPSPPPAPDSNSSVQKAAHRSPWLWLVLLILALMAVGIFAARLYFDYYRAKFKVPAPVSALVTSCIQSMSVLEDGFRRGCAAAVLYIWTVGRHIFARGWQYHNIVLLAAAGHCLGILVVFAHRSLRAPVVAVVWLHWYPLSSFLVPLAVVASSVKLSWILWIGYHLGDEIYPSIGDIHQIIIDVPSYLSVLLGAPDSIDLANKYQMILGPLIIHAAMMSFWAMALTILAIPSAFRVLRLLRPLLMTFPRNCILSIAGLVVWALFWFSLLQFNRLTPYGQQLVWQAFFCPKSRAELLEAGRYLMERHLHWKMGRIQEFHALGLQLQRSFWAAINLIVAPAALFYGHFHIIPAARKLLLTIRNWRRRDTYTFFLLPHLHASVENRLAAATRRPGEAPIVTPSSDTTNEQRIRRDTNEAAGAAMGFVGDALPFSPPAHLSPPRY
ncbi:hypothetical protein B0H11DRAFT_2194686 [Mycena galericulata]|nr:hypothetical protein B0H11DRAFT_2194686 [Mycena galericulata]